MTAARRSIPLLLASLLAVSATAEPPLIDQLQTARITRVRSYASDVQIDARGAALVDGKYLLNTGDVADFVTRILPSGEIDLRYTLNAHNLFARDEVAPGLFAVALQPDGRLLAAIGAPTQDGTTSATEIVRLNPDGTRDGGFSTRGVFGTGNLVYAMRVLPDGKILTAGRILSGPGNSSAAVLRLLPDGALDPDFRSARTPLDVAGIAAFAIEPARAGLFLLGKGPWRSGTIAEANEEARVTRVDRNGQEQPAFDRDALKALRPGVFALARVSGGNVVAGGISTLIRVLPTGAIDPFFKAPAFRPTVPQRPWVIRTIRVQPDGKLLVGGDFLTPGGASGIARLFPDGRLDESFERRVGAGFRSGGGVQQGLSALALQADGRIICVGSFETLNGQDQRTLARLKPDGTPDAWPAIATVGLR